LVQEAERSVAHSRCIFHSLQKALSVHYFQRKCPLKVTSLGCQNDAAVAWREKQAVSTNQQQDLYFFCSWQQQSH
jgi:hypothetical protein